MNTETMTAYIAIFDERHPPKRQQHPGLFSLFDGDPGYVRFSNHCHLLQHSGSLPEVLGAIQGFLAIGDTVVVVACDRVAWPTVHPERNRNLTALFGRNFLES